MTRNRGLWAAVAAAAAIGVALLLPTHHLAHPQAPAGRQPAGAPSQVLAAPANGNGSPAAAGSPAPSVSPSIKPASEPARPAAEALWRPVAAGFARDFADPGTGSETDKADWLARVGRWTTPYLIDQYRQTDPHRIPTATLRSIKPIATGETTVSFVAAYDTGLTLDCRVELGPTGWKVTTASPAVAR
ncbi:MAG: hypothetical protein M3O55_07450 [Actinomycetota bacterium]|nr:hypothetical protein [Actinomycetota bacterium]